jgi:antitoxin ChpS
MLQDAGKCLPINVVILKYNLEKDTMHTTNLRKVGGSIMLAVPPALLDILHLRPGAKVGLAVRNGRLVVEPQQRPRYTLDELLLQCKPKAPRRKEEREWLDDKPAGRELI